jgi:regulator of sigma E protease
MGPAGNAKHYSPERLKNMITALATIFVLGVLVFVHELGHFIAAKMFGIRVEKFSLGFPPKMFGVTVGETEYLISWLPIGGYVKMAGQDDFKPVAGQGQPWEFYTKSSPIKIAVLSAGSIFNWVFAFLVFWCVILVTGVASIRTTQIGGIKDTAFFKENSVAVKDYITTVNGRDVSTWEDIYRQLAANADHGRSQTMIVRKYGTNETITFGLACSRTEFFDNVQPLITTAIGKILPGSPADRAGLKAQDLIVAVNDSAVGQWDQLVALVQNHPGDTIKVTWLREGKADSARLVPMVKEMMDEQKQIKKIGLIGITTMTGNQKVGFFKSCELAAENAASWTKRIVLFIYDLISGQASLKYLRGPITIAQMAGESARYGWESLFIFMAILGINLAIVNILPLPMFDGGHVLITIIEAITRRQLTFRQRVIIQQVGLAIIIGLTVFVLFNDIVGLKNK